MNRTAGEPDALKGARPVRTGGRRKRTRTTGTSPAAYRCLYVLEAAGLAVQLVNAAQARNLPGRPKTDKLDAMWLARLTEMGLLRPSFVPPAAIRELRDYTRARTRLAQERTRCFQRPGKAAGRRPDQAVERGQQADHRLGPGHDQGDDRRPA